MRLSFASAGALPALAARQESGHARRCVRLVAAAAPAGTKGGGRPASGSTWTKPTYTQGRGGPMREYKASDGKLHLGSALVPLPNRPFPGPPPDEGPPLTVLPIGGLGEIGMNCMLVGARGRYILIDAGLMFPDFTDLGMQKILPDSSFLHEWRDKIEAVVITHGHEDHIGALPWVVPALDPNTPIYTSSFVSQLVQRRLTEFSLFEPSRFKQFTMKVPFQAGPFEIVPIRVTHSIPDCCGLIMRSQYGTIVHTGDWKIDETPIDGEQFDRESLDLLGKEKVALLMSDSTNVLAPGRTFSEQVVKDALIRRVLEHNGKGRVICTQFASNLHRLYSVKQAADAAGRKVCFIGASLNTYLEAAWRDGRAPIDPRDLIAPGDLSSYDPNTVLIVTTGSQAEPRAQLSLAARGASPQLKLRADDLLLYSAKVIPGNETKVCQMMNSIAQKGTRIMQGRGDNLHTSGHAYADELLEVMQLVKPQAFLPVHGEYAFLCEHARLAKEKAGIHNTMVIRNGQMLGVAEHRSLSEVSSGSLALALLGDVNLQSFYNDGSRGTGSDVEMNIPERAILAFEGVVVMSVDVERNGGMGLDGNVRITTRGMWTEGGKLLDALYQSAKAGLSRMSGEASLVQVERVLIDTVKKECRKFNSRKPEVIVVAHEYDFRAADTGASEGARVKATQNTRIHAPATRQDDAPPSSSARTAGGRPPNDRARAAAPPPSGASSGSRTLSPARRTPTTSSRAPGMLPLPPSVMEQRRAANPRETPDDKLDADFG